jgi:hypothetical protein
MAPDDGDDDEAVRAFCERRGLRFKPWETTPWCAHEGEGPAPDGSMGARTWPEALRLRRRILAAIEAGEDDL